MSIICRGRARGDGAREIVLTPAQYRRLAAYHPRELRDGGARYRGYAGYDAFYERNGAV